MRAVTLVGACLIVIACGRAAQTTPSIISGVVEAGPTCPVEIEGKPCPPRKVDDATVTAEDRDGRTAATARTDKTGSFRLSVPAGTYELTAESKSVFGCDAQTAIVSEGRGASIRIACDTGIR